MNSTFVNRLKTDYPEFVFRSGKKYLFRPPKTIVWGQDEYCSELLLLHELSHALLGHRDFGTDVERLKMERQAWAKARELAAIYKVKIDEDLIQEELDTYREWLHQKSRCPKCGLTRFQTPDKVYHCPKCDI